MKQKGCFTIGGTFGQIWNELSSNSISGALRLIKLPSGTCHFTKIVV